MQDVSVLSVLEWLQSQKKVREEAVLEHQCADGIAAEIWADIRRYEGRYQVSTLGRVKSVARFRRTKRNGQTWMPERIMKVHIKKKVNRTLPYAEIHLRDGSSRDVRSKAFLVHRLVADAFIKQLQPTDEVDHINGAHSDNRVENLRVMHYVEHGKLHPLAINPLKHDPVTGQFLRRVA
jgi:hypothetical protein